MNEIDRTITALLEMEFAARGHFPWAIDVALLSYGQDDFGTLRVSVQFPPAQLTFGTAPATVVGVVLDKVCASMAPTGITYLARAIADLILGERDRIERGLKPLLSYNRRKG